MTRDLIVWSLLAGSAGLVWILAYGVLSGPRTGRRSAQERDDPGTSRTDRVSTPTHPETTL